MSGTAITLIILLGIAVVAAFLIAWTLDARRAEKVSHDDERLDVDPDPAAGTAGDPAVDPDIAVDPIDPARTTRADGSWVDDAAAAKPRVDPEADPGTVPEGWGDDPYGRPPADRGMR